MLRETCSWKEAGCRKNSSTLVGQMQASVKHVTKRKAQKNTGFYQGFGKMGAKSENLNGGVEVAKRYCNAPHSVKASGTGVSSVCKCGNPEHKSWSMPAVGFNDNVAADGSFLGAAGK